MVPVIRGGRALAWCWPLVLGACASEVQVRAVAITGEVFSGTGVVRWDDNVTGRDGFGSWRAAEDSAVRASAAREIPCAVDRVRIVFRTGESSEQAHSNAITASGCGIRATYAESCAWAGEVQRCTFLLVGRVPEAAAP